MSILLATIFRVIDGLPLSASTDVVQKREVKDCQKYVKLVSKKLYQLPDKCTLELQGFRIHLISTMDISFVVLVEDSYSTVLAFSFLNEIQKEFLLKFDRDVVAGIKRPYALIEFDLFLQKTKQRYNSPRTLSTRLDLSLISQEMKLRPPYAIREEDIYVGIQGGYYNNGNVTHAAAKNVYRPPGDHGVMSVTVAPTQQLAPLPWYGWLSVALNVFCALLNLLRGMTIISHGHFDDEDRGAYRGGVCFLLTASIYIYQVYLMFFFKRRLKYLSVTSFLVVCVCHIFLFHLRNWIQITFHIATSILASYVHVTRKTQGKLPGYNV